MADGRCRIGGFTICARPSSLAAPDCAFGARSSKFNHVSESFGGVRRVYNLHSYEDERREAMEAWARHIGDILAPNVVALRPVTDDHDALYRRALPLLRRVAERETVAYVGRELGEHLAGLRVLATHILQREAAVL